MASFSNNDMHSKKKNGTYFDTLDTDAKSRYIEKISVIDNVDPYSIDNSRLSSSPGSLPGITYPDIVNYLVNNPSPYTLQDLKSYKGLEAYNQFVSGWVREVKSTVINGHHVVVGRVLHSQRLRETPLKPWLVAESHGNVICGHCDCMAGLGETCTHVSALLFYIETTVRIRDSRTVTEEAAYWKLPTSGKDRGVAYRPIAEIDFSSAKSKKRKLDELVNDISTPSPCSSSKSTNTRIIPEPTSDDIDSLFEGLKSIGSRAAVLSIVPKYSVEFKPTVLHEKYPTAMSELFKPECASLTFNEIISVCCEIDISVSSEQIKCVEEATRTQSASKLWFRFRAGRITASKMKRVCRTDVNKPALSLVRDICYPSSQAFSTPATKWGCEHEEMARNSYIEEMQSRHDNFNVIPTGFYISADRPFIGASPDGRVSCDCCGEGLIEVKCPFCGKDSDIADYANMTRSCLYEEGRNYLLKKDHEYMYQVQTQLLVCQHDYVDFVLWTSKDIHIQRIEADSDIINEICSKSEDFFAKALLPELIGKWFTRSTTVLCETKKTQSNKQDNCDQYCYCKGPEDLDDMIACDSENCAILWFHIGCLDIKQIPKGDWYCPDCRKGFCV